MFLNFMTSLEKLISKFFDEYEKNESDDLWWTLRLVLENFVLTYPGQKFSFTKPPRKNLNASNFFSQTKTWGQGKDKNSSLRKTTPNTKFTVKIQRNFFVQDMFRTKFSRASLGRTKEEQNLEFTMIFNVLNKVWHFFLEKVIRAFGGWRIWKRLRLSLARPWAIGRIFNQSKKKFLDFIEQNQRIYFLQNWIVKIFLLFFWTLLSVSPRLHVFKSKSKMKLVKKILKKVFVWHYLAYRILFCGQNWFKLFLCNILQSQFRNFDFRDSPWKAVEEQTRSKTWSFLPFCPKFSF